MKVITQTEICPSCDGAGFDFYHHEQKPCGYCGGRGVVRMQSVDGEFDLAEAA